MSNISNIKTKSPDLQNLIKQALEILEKFGIFKEKKTEARQVSIAMTFLAVAGIKKHWNETINIEDDWVPSTKAIITFINENYSENINPGSYDSIRNKNLEPLVEAGLINNISKNPNASKYSPTKGYSLESGIKNILKTLDTRNLNSHFENFFKERNNPKFISEIHNNLFDFLNNWSEINSSLVKNPFFSIRVQEDDFFKKGHWFPGNERYLALSFWSGSDVLNRTPNIYISIDFTGDIVAYIVARDSEIKAAYFEKLVLKLKGFTLNKENSIWLKKLGEFSLNNVYEIIEKFINNEKEIIDRYIFKTLEENDENELDIFNDEYSSKFGFINKVQFYKLVNRVDAQRKILSSGNSKAINIDELMPMSLKLLEVKDYHGIKHLKIDDLPPNAKWIFITGENGFGKTSVLQAIALGITNFTENIKYLEKNSRIFVGYNKQSQYYQNIVTESYNEDFDSLNQNFIAYGPIRLIAQATSSRNIESYNSTNVYHIFNRDGLLKNVDYLLMTSSLKLNKKEFQNLSEAIIKIVDKRIAEIKIDSNTGTVKYLENDDDGKYLASNSFNQLATGFQGLINIVADIIVRFGNNFPESEFKNFEGIILIDELENHLHPIFQKKLPTLLSSIFPKIQFICSIHSPIPLLGASKNSVILNVNRKKADGITIDRIDEKFDLDTLNPNIILTSPIFGLNDIFSINIGKKRVDTSDSFDQSRLRLLLKEKLQQFEKPNKNDTKE